MPKKCGLTILQTRRLRGVQIVVFKILNGYENIEKFFVDSKLYLQYKSYYCYYIVLYLFLNNCIVIIEKNHMNNIK